MDPEKMTEGGEVSETQNQRRIELPLRFYDVLARISLRIARDEIERRTAEKEAEAQATVTLVRFERGVDWELEEAKRKRATEAKTGEGQE